MVKFAAEYSPQIRPMNKFLILFLASTFLFSCEKPEENSAFLIVTTTGILGDGVKNFVPEGIEVISLMGPGIDPHLYKPTSSDLSKLRKADLIVYNGIALEGKMEEILENLSKKKPTIPISAFISKEDLIQSEAFVGSYDPHIWFDVELWRKGLLGLRDSIYTVTNWKIEDSEPSDQNERLLKLDSGLKEKFLSIPEERRLLVTAHDAFSYFGRAYSIEVIGLQGISTLSEAGLKDISNLVDFIIDNEIKKVFVETMVSEKGIDAVLEGCRLKGYEVEKGGTLYSDALGAEGTDQDNYIGMVKYNSELILKALE